MSPKVSRPADESGEEPEELAIPPGHVPITPRAKSTPKRPKPISVWWKVGGLVVVLAATVATIVYLAQPADPRSTARGTAELVAESLSNADRDGFASYLCDAEELDPAQIREQVTSTARLAGRMTVLDVSGELDGVASATLTSSRRPDIDTVLLMADRDDSWCLVTMSACPVSGDTSGQSAPDLSGCRNRPGRVT